MNQKQSKKDKWQTEKYLQNIWQARIGNSKIKKTINKELSNIEKKNSNNVIEILFKKNCS